VWCGSDINNYRQDTEPSLVTMLSTTNAPVYLHSPQIASFRALPETNRLALIMRCGDIAVLSLDEDESTVSCISRCILIVTDLEYLRRIASLKLREPWNPEFQQLPGVRMIPY